MVEESVTEDVAAALLDALREQKEYVAEQATREFEQQLDVEPMTNSGGQPVAADGGSILSETTYNTLTVGAMFLNGLTIGSELQAGGLEQTGILAAVATVLLMIGWFGRNYDIGLSIDDGDLYY